MKAGETVTVSGLAVQFKEYETMLWVIEENQEATVVLRSMQMSKLIRVSQLKIAPSSLSIPAAAQARLSQTLNFQFDLPFHWKMESWIVSKLTAFRDGRPEPDLERYLNVWIPLPDDQNGGNRILLRKCEGERRPLLMYPRLEALGLELVFESRWYGGRTVVIEIDILKPCPQRHIWIFCAWCGKFHLPFDGPNSHRSSRKHNRGARWYLDFYPKDWLRAQCGFMHVEGRWL